MICRNQLFLQKLFSFLFFASMPACGMSVVGKLFTKGVAPFCAARCFSSRSLFKITPDQQEALNQNLINAIRHQHELGVHAAIEEGAQVGKSDEENYPFTDEYGKHVLSPLAAYLEGPEQLLILRELLQHGANPILPRSAWHGTAVETALFEGQHASALEMACVIPNINFKTSERVTLLNFALNKCFGKPIHVTKVAHFLHLGAHLFLSEEKNLPLSPSDQFYFNPIFYNSAALWQESVMQFVVHSLLDMVNERPGPINIIYHKKFQEPMMTSWLLRNVKTSYRMQWDAAISQSQTDILLPDGCRLFCRHQ